MNNAHLTQPGQNVELLVSRAVPTCMIPPLVLPAVIRQHVLALTTTSDSMENVSIGETVLVCLLLVQRKIVFIDVDKHSTQHEAVETVTVPGASVSVVVTTAPKVAPTTAKAPIPKITTCAVNETVNECGKACEADCQSIFTRSECSDCGEPACSCLQGYARNVVGQCVYWGDCPPEGKSFE